jgi:hypothetical protein
MTNILDALKDFKKEIEQNQFIEVVRFEIEDALSLADIIIIEEELNIKIPLKIKEFYLQVASINIFWILKKDAPVELLLGEEYGQVNGKMNIADLYTLFSDVKDEARWENILWFYNMDDKEALGKNKDLCPFDFFDNNNGECVGFSKNKIDKGDSSLFLRDDKGSIFPYPMAINAYITDCISKKAFFRSQAALLFPESIDAIRINYYLAKIFK